MTILHLYDDSDSMAAHYAAVLTQAVGSRARMYSATSASSLQKCLEEHQPAIVHLHGAPRIKVPHGLRIVVTPHGQKLTPAIKPYVVIARSKMEQQALSFERTEVVFNPIITRTTTPEACAQQMLAIYKRVMQSDVLALMDKPTRKTLPMLLLAAITADSRWLGGIDVSPLLKQAQFQQLYIYTHHEGALPLMQQGLRVLGHQAPPIEPFCSYLPPGYQQPQPMEGADIPTLLADVKVNGPSLLRLCELASALRSDSLDEESLLSQLDQTSMRPLFAQVLRLLSEQTLLTEGFMPCQPASEYEAQPLSQQLRCRQSIV